MIGVYEGNDGHRYLKLTVGEDSLDLNGTIGTIVSDFAERLVVMADGCILARGATADVFADAALMARARVTPPQVVELSARLAQEVSPAFAHETEVSGIVDTTVALAGSPAPTADPEEALRA